MIQSTKPPDPAETTFGISRLKWNLLRRTNRERTAAHPGRFEQQISQMGGLRRIQGRKRIRAFVRAIQEIILCLITTVGCGRISLEELPIGKDDSDSSGITHGSDSENPTGADSASASDTPGDTATVTDSGIDTFTGTGIDTVADTGIDTDTSTTTDSSGTDTNAGNDTDADTVDTDTMTDTNFGTCPALPALVAPDDTDFYSMDTDISHGSIVSVQPNPGNGKNMQIYTPPGYQSDTESYYPVLYLNPGGTEDETFWACSDNANCGYAGLILDNLLAAGQATPMIIAMPDTSDCAIFDPPAPPDFPDPCTTEYVEDFIPYIESNYRVIAHRNFRSIGGKLMGGVVTLNTGFHHLEIFSQLYVYSSGYPEQIQRDSWEINAGDILNNPGATNALLNAPIYFADGDTASTLAYSIANRDILINHGIQTFWQSSRSNDGWASWRRYLHQTLPVMFQNTNGCP